MSGSPPFSGNKATGIVSRGDLFTNSRESQGLSWERDGQDWPNREFSRFVEAAGIRWHVQVMGQGPVLLLLHGTGAASVSWRDLATQLVNDYTVVMPDLPGHGFSQMPPLSQLSLPGMAAMVGQLMASMKMNPHLVAGHSAGAAIAAQMCLDGSIDPVWIISFNGAWLPWEGLPGWLFSPLARLLAGNGLWASLLARHATQPQVAKRLIDRTGSLLGQKGIELYSRLIRNSQHTAAALGMMANWNLGPLLSNLSRLRPRLLLVVGENDHMVPPEQAHRLHAMLPNSRIQSLAGFGHLLHEESPRKAAELILAVEQGAQSRWMS